MRSALILTALLFAACHGSDSATNTGSATAGPTTPSAKPAPAPVPSGSAAPSGTATAQAPAPAPTPAASPPVPPTIEGHDFTSEAKALLAVGACGDGATPEGITAEEVSTHCDVVKKAQADYTDAWVKPARTFFEAHVPKDIPKKVVYPFAGGDLSTALTVYPDADEITTISLAPALKFLYRVNFSNTINMIDAMRGGQLPTELIFALSALKVHGYELVGLHYFKLNDDGSLHYLDDKDLEKAPSIGKAKAEVRNWQFANAELLFRKPGGRVQIYRHIRQNLGNEESKGIGPGLKQDPRVIKYLEAKGPVSAMTKAASYLLSWDSFSIMRDYLTSHVVWMVSDATGVAPKWGKPAGYEYETYGDIVGPHIPAGSGISKDWRTEFDSQPHRELGFRFGYYDKKNANHLFIMRKKKA